jgi:hypothetical protein
MKVLYGENGTRFLGDRNCNNQVVNACACVNVPNGVASFALYSVSALYCVSALSLALPSLCQTTVSTDSVWLGGGGGGEGGGFESCWRS